MLRYTIRVTFPVNLCTQSELTEVHELERLMKEVAAGLQTSPQGKEIRTIVTNDIINNLS